MAVNKVVVGDEVLIDLTKDTVTPEDVRTGVTFHMCNGEEATGTCEMDVSSETTNPSLTNKGLINKVVSKNNILVDLTQDTITPYDVIKGKTFHMRNGECSVGVYENISNHLVMELYSASEGFYTTNQTSTIKFTAATGYMRNTLYLCNEDYLIIFRIYKNNGDSFIDPTFTCNGTIMGSLHGSYGVYTHSRSSASIEGGNDVNSQQFIFNCESSNTNKQVSLQIPGTHKEIFLSFHICEPYSGMSGSPIYLNLNNMLIDNIKFEGDLNITNR